MGSWGKPYKGKDLKRTEEQQFQKALRKRLAKTKERKAFYAAHPCYTWDETEQKWESTILEQAVLTRFFLRRGNINNPYELAGEITLANCLERGIVY